MAFLSFSILRRAKLGWTGGCRTPVDFCHWPKFSHIAHYSSNDVGDPSANLQKYTSSSSGIDCEGSGDDKAAAPMGKSGSQPKLCDSPGELGRRLLDPAVPTFQDFMRQQQHKHSPVHNPNLLTDLTEGDSSGTIPQPAVGVLEDDSLTGGTAINSMRQGAALNVYLETYGCQMNVSDSQVVMSILSKHGYKEAAEAEAADVILVNTCAIRENAESKIWQRLGAFRNMKTKKKRDKRPTVGVLGCMAERLKEKLLESDKLVDLVVGPDAYRDLPRLLSTLRDSYNRSATAMNVQLSLDETYADVMPVRREGSVSAYLSIMRGCNNMCAFCIVPFTRGRERSRDVDSILQEVKALSGLGVKEVTLLGQNVNSYADYSHLTQSDNHDDSKKATYADSGLPALQNGSHSASLPDRDEESFKEHYADGFRSVYKPNRSGAVSFAELLRRVAQVDPEMRIRFTSPHPKDFTDDVLDAIATYPNICSHLHMPAQSGSTAMLQAMRRGYTREAYDALIQKARERIPQVALSTDIIVGFCGETEQDHNATLSLMRDTKYDQAFMFAYSRREKTYAARHLKDDVPQDVKQRRLQEVIAAFREGVTARNNAEIGRRHLVLVDGPSKRDSINWTGRTDTFKRAIFNNPFVHQQHDSLHDLDGGKEISRLSTDLSLQTTCRMDEGTSVCSWTDLKAGDYVEVQVIAATAGSLQCVSIEKTTIAKFVAKYGSTTPSENFEHHRTTHISNGSASTAVLCSAALQHSSQRITN